MNFFKYCCCKNNKIHDIDMANAQQKIIDKKKIYTDLKIASFNVKLDQSIHKNEKINTIIELLTTNNIDILCLQNVIDCKTLRYLYKKIYNYDKTLHFYPSVNTVKNTSSRSESESESDDNSAGSFNNDNTLQISFSRSTEDNTIELRNVFISKHPIINGAHTNIGSYFGVNNYIGIANINYNGIILSVYNVVLQTDFTGISNRNIRDTQINIVSRIIEKNKNIVKTDSTFNEYDRRNINIICANLNIPEFKNNMSNDEFIKCIKKINGLDVYRFIEANLNKKKSNKIDNINFREDYVILVLNMFENIEQSNINFDKQLLKINKDVFEKHRMLVKGIHIKKFIDYFDTNPILITFLIEECKSMPKDVQQKEIAISIND